MLNSKECAEFWKQIVCLYRESIDTDNNPETCIHKIVEKIGYQNTLQTFAAVAAIKKHDGRISSLNRNFLSTVEIYEEVVKWERGNPMVYAGLDDIHTAHIDNLLTQLRRGSFTNKE